MKYFIFVWHFDLPAVSLPSPPPLPPKKEKLTILVYSRASIGLGVFLRFDRLTSRVGYYQAKKKRGGGLRELNRRGVRHLRTHPGQFAL